MEFDMAKKFQSLGVMIDMSRNAVMSIPSLKRYLPLLKKMGYDTAKEFNDRLMNMMM